MVAHTCASSTWEAKVQELASEGQPWLHRPYLKNKKFFREIDRLINLLFI